MVTIQLHVSHETDRALATQAELTEGVLVELRRRLNYLEAIHPTHCMDMSCEYVIAIADKRREIEHAERVLRFIHDVRAGARCAQAAAS